MKLAVVTDSTACLPPYRIEQADISIVPVQVTVNDVTYDEGVGISSSAVVAALREGADVTTNRPSPARFADVYRQLAFDGATEILSIHLSSELSGTYSSAVLAAREAEIPVRVIDSRTIGLGLGFGVLAAADARSHGASALDIADVATKVTRAARAWLYVETMDQLRRGGRIGVAQAAVGTALAIKPILEVTGGRVVARDKVRTSSRAASRLVELAVEAAEALGGQVEIGVQHAGVRTAADAVAVAVGKALPGVPVVISDLGAVLAAHAGPGAVALIVAPVVHSA